MNKPHYKILTNLATDNLSMSIEFFFYTQIYMENLFNFIYDHENLFVIIDLHDKVWFSGNDIARILEYKAPKKIIEKYVPSNLKITYENIDIHNKIYSKSYQNKSIFIDEAGLFRLIFKSKQNKAIEFQNWVTDIVLPKLRHEGYIILKQKIELLQNKIIKIRNENKLLVNENNYLTNKTQYIPSNKGFIYIIQVKTTRKGKYKICYKLGHTKNLKKRLTKYRTGNPNVKLISYFSLKNVNSELVEKCSKAVLKYKELKKNNEIYCTSLKNIYKIISSCIDNMEELIGVCVPCKQKMATNEIIKHKCDKV